MREAIRSYLEDLLVDLAMTDGHIALLIILLVVIAVVLDAFSKLAVEKQKKTGLKAESILETALGKESFPAKLYVSDMQGLSGKPDALIHENGFIIPVERKAFSKKIRDRYLNQLLVYLRLVEEFEGKKPPYGYLVLGKQNRLVKVHNTPENQAKLQKVIDKMHAIMNKEQQAKAEPHPRKCAKCNVIHHCNFKAVD